MSRKVWVTAMLAVSVMTAACAQFETSHETLTPSAPAPIPGGSTTGPLVGRWIPDEEVVNVLPSTCGNFKWEITSQSATEIDGHFTAECAGEVTIDANVHGLLSNATTVTLSVSGTGIINGFGCPFTLNGIGTIFDDNNAITIPYIGTTCFGPVKGTETVRRPPPPVPPAPPPPPGPPEDPLFGCGVIVDKYRLVECLHSVIRPTDHVGAFEVTKRVAWALRGEGAGLLIKNGGENVVWWQGHSFAAARILYPDNHLYKVLADVGPGGANAPSWQDEGIDPGLQGRWMAPMHPNLP